MMAKKIFAVLAVLLIAGVGVWNWQRGNETLESIVGGDKPVVKIGALLPLTGNNADLGKAAKAGILLALEEIQNKNLQNDYEIIFEDTQNKAANVSTLANKLININKADAIITFLIGNAKIVAPIADKHHILHLSTSLENKNFARFGANTFVQGTAVEDMQNKIIEVLQEQAVDNLAIVAADVGVSALAAQQLKIYAEQAGIRSEVKSFNPGERDFRILIEGLKEEGYNHFYVSAFPPETDILIRQLNEAGIHNEQIFGQGIDTSADKPDYNGITCFGLNLGSESFIEKVKKRFGLATVYGASVNYDLVNLAVKAFENSSVHTQKAVQYIHNLKKYDCVSGGCKVLENGFIINPPGKNILMWIRNK